MTTQLPHADLSIIDERKITGYLLAEAHEGGGPKARFFIAFGWSVEQPEQLRADLRLHACTNSVVLHYATDHGIKYEVVGALIAPNSQSVTIKTVWIVLDGEQIPRLVTAVPA